MIDAHMCRIFLVVQRDAFVVYREGSLPKSKILVQVVSDCICLICTAYSLQTVSIGRQSEVTAMEPHLHCIVMPNDNFIVIPSDNYIVIPSDKCKVD